MSNPSKLESCLCTDTPVQALSKYLEWNEPWTSERDITGYTRLIKFTGDSHLKFPLWDGSANPTPTIIRTNPRMSYIYSTRIDI